MYCWCVCSCFGVLGGGLCVVDVCVVVAVSVLVVVCVVAAMLASVRVLLLCLR